MPSFNIYTSLPDGLRAAAGGIEAQDEAAAVEQWANAQGSAPGVYYAVRTDALVSVEVEAETVYTVRVNA